MRDNIETIIYDYEENSSPVYPIKPILRSLQPSLTETMEYYDRLKLYTATVARLNCLKQYAESYFFDALEQLYAPIYKVSHETFLHAIDATYSIIPVLTGNAKRFAEVLETVLDFYVKSRDGVDIQFRPPNGPIIR